ncbi:hypothetical protein Tco_1279838 [Tanacetum coccineum]
MVAIDGAGFDWSYVADNEVPKNMAIMAFSNSELNKSESNLATYKRGLAFVEEQFVFYKKNEVIFYEQLAVLKRDISYKDSKISMLKSELEKLKQEKESNKLKIENFDNASKKEFQQPEFEGYGPKTSKSVSEDTFNEVKESLNASLVEELVSNDKLEKKTVFPTVAKIKKFRPQQQEKPIRKLVKYAEIYRPNTAVVNDVRENQVNAVKASACWVWRPTKLNNASITFKRHNYGHPQKEDQGYVDSGCSRHMTGNMSYLSDFQEFDE